MAFKSLKNHITNLATPFLSNAISNMMKPSSAGDAGKVAAKLLNKSPFEIDNTRNVIEDPLKFAYKQYPIDLGSNELGHYIMFDSGFVQYNAHTSNFLGTRNKITNEKIQAKLPDKSINTSSIAIYMPPNIKVSYNQTYDSEPGGIFAGGEVLADKVRSSKEAEDKIINALRGSAALAAQKGKQILGEFISLAGQGDPIKVGLKRAGKAMNPRNEQFYDSPAFREFTYEFDFWPRSEKEAMVVRDIIQIFKYNSSPGLNQDTLGGFFDTPNYFQIKYMYKDRVHPNLHLISAAYCKSVEVDYQPDGQTSFLNEGKDGTGPFPAHTKLSVSFVEDRIITKSDISAGA